MTPPGFQSHSISSDTASTQAGVTAHPGRAQGLGNPSSGASAEAPPFHSLPQFPLHLLPGPLSHAAVGPQRCRCPLCPPRPQLSPPASLHTPLHAAAPSAAAPQARTASLIISIFVSNVSGHCAALPENSHLGDLPATVGSFYCYSYPTHVSLEKKKPNQNKNTKAEESPGSPL